MNRLAGVATLMLFAQVAATSSFAGVADSPLPKLVAGKTTYHLYSVPGLRDTASVATYFSCTSLERTAAIQVGVEVFPGAGGLAWNDVVATSVSIVPGQTVSFATRLYPWPTLGANVDLNAALISQGSARILATSRKVMCTAFLADPQNLPPTSMTYLPIIKGTTQKGD